LLLHLAAQVNPRKTKSRSSIVPQVGSKKFPYTPAGKAAAKKAAAKAGQKMKPAPAKKKKMM
jgi:hypothetical protein